MTPTETAATLRQLTDWRKGVDVDPPKPGEVFEAIDAAIEMIERAQELEIALREFAWSEDSESRADCARSVLEESK
jgi:hypothetical protein